MKVINKYKFEVHLSIKKANVYKSALAVLVLFNISCTANFNSNLETKTLPANVTKSCAVLKHKNWHGWIDKFSNESQNYRLNVSAEVTFPTPGFSIEWKQGPMDRRFPPTLRLNLIPTYPEGPTVQMLTTEKIHYTFDTPISKFSSVLVFCDDTLLSEIVDVRLTD